MGQYNNAHHNSKLYRYLVPADPLKEKSGINFFLKSISKGVLSNRINRKIFESSKLGAGQS